MKFRVLSVSFWCCLLITPLVALSQDSIDAWAATPTNYPPSVTPAVIPPVPDELLLPVEPLSGTNVSPSFEPPKEIRPIEGGAVADFGRTTIYFATDPASVPAVTVIAADGQRLSFRASYLVLTSRSTGQSVVLSELSRRCAGTIVSPSEVLYERAFGIADLCYEYDWRSDSLVQFVTFRENFTLPKGFDAADLRLECWTEWIEGEPLEERRSRVVVGLDSQGRAIEEDNAELNFGAIRMLAHGKAFALGEEQESIPVTKSLELLEVQPSAGDSEGEAPTSLFLIEAVNYETARPSLDKLPKAKEQAMLLRRAKSRKEVVSTPPARSPGEPSQGSMLMAMHTPETTSGFVIDFSLAGCYAQPSGLVSWWEAQGNAQDSKGANHGTMSGVAFGLGEVGQGFQFTNSSGSVFVNDSPTLDFGAGADFSIEAWVKPETNTTEYGVQTIVDKRNTPTSTQAVGYALYLAHGKLGFQMADAPLAAGQYSSFGPVGNDLRADGNWHHVAVTVDRDAANGLKLYVDGVPVATNNPTGEPGDLSTSVPFRIGKHSQTNFNGGFTGGLDEASVYNRVLSSAEIASIYNARMAGKCGQCCVCLTPPTGVEGWWRGEGNGFDSAKTTGVALRGGASFAAGQVGQAFNLNGTSAYLEAADSGSWAFGSGDFSLELWVQFRSYTAKTLSNPEAVFIANDEGGGNLNKWMFALGGGYLNLHVNSPTLGSRTIGATAFRPSTGAWYHLAAVRSGSTITFYVNGYAVGSGAITFGLPNPAAPLTMGQAENLGFIDGLIDEPAIYNRALTASEVNLLFTAGIAGKCFTDTDGDGLSDAQETSLGSSATSADTDKDGLRDGDEVFIHRTSATAQDTDGDGVIDQPLRIQITRPKTGSLLP